MSKPEQHRIAIIGGGIAGLTAAAAPEERGFSVRVFDKGRRPAGRISTRTREPGSGGDHAGVAFDHGAQYFTVRNERFRAFIDSCIEADCVCEWKGRIVAIDADGVSVSESQTRYVGVPAMSAIADRLAKPLSVASGTRVARLHRTSSGWQLYDEADARLATCDALVMAIPAPQAADLLPPGHVLAPRLRTCTFHPCWAAMVRFEQAVPVSFDGAFINTLPLSWIARNNSKPGRPEAECWVLHGAPAWSRAHLEMDAEVAGAALTTAFGILLEDQLAVAMPEPVEVHAHRWRFALPADPLEEGILHDASSGVTICGDYCHGARVEGAYLSGFAAARKVDAGTC